MQTVASIKTIYQNNYGKMLAACAILGSGVFIFEGYRFLGSYFSTLLGFGLAAFFLCVVFFRWPITGLLLMLALAPAEELVVMPGGRTIIFGIGILVMFIWLMQLLIGGGEIVLAKIPTLIFSLFIFWGLLSYFWAQDQFAVLIRMLTIINLFLFYVLFQNLVKTGRELKIIFLTVFAAGLFYSLVDIAIGLYAGTARPTLAEGQNPNNLARSLLIALLLAPYVFGITKSRFLKFLAVLAGLAILVAVIMTGSRGALVGIALAVPFTFLVAKDKIALLKNIFIGGLLAAVCVFVLYQAGIISKYVTMLLNSFNITPTHSLVSRLDIWTVGLEMVESSPLIGVGLDNFPGRFEEFIVPSSMGGRFGVEPGRDPHNVFLSVQAELGIVGTALFLLFFWSMLVQLSKFRGDPRAVAGILILSFLFFTQITGTIQYTKFFWAGIAIASTVPLVLMREKKHEGD